MARRRARQGCRPARTARGDGRAGRGRRAGRRRRGGRTRGCRRRTARRRRRRRPSAGTRAAPRRRRRPTPSVPGCAKPAAISPVQRRCRSARQWRSNDAVYSDASVRAISAAPPGERQSISTLRPWRAMWSRNARPNSNRIDSLSAVMTISVSCADPAGVPGLRERATNGSSSTASSAASDEPGRARPCHLPSSSRRQQHDVLRRHLHDGGGSRRGRRRGGGVELVAGQLAVADAQPALRDVAEVEEAVLARDGLGAKDVGRRRCRGGTSPAGIRGGSRSRPRSPAPARTPDRARPPAGRSRCRRGCRPRPRRRPAPRAGWSRR